MSCPFSGQTSETVTDEAMKEGEMLYSNYLCLDKLLSAQKLKSAEAGDEAHDELLFVIIHQTYELWFKQILHELDSVIAIFNRDYIEEKYLGTVVSRLIRIVEILKILVDQVRILETMFPLDFLDFRKYLGNASGFQSLQFRLIENKLGVLPSLRVQYQKNEYANYFQSTEQKILHESHNSPTLLRLVDKWLARTPFLEFQSFQFWQEYRNAVDEMLREDLELVDCNPHLTEDQKHKRVENCRLAREMFEGLFNEEKHKEFVEKGLRRFSYKSLKAALLISLYRDEPILHTPFRILSLLMDIDVQMTTWRYRHSSMVHRMIGSKIGTGGSSGYAYLRSTVTDRYKVFLDLFNLSTFLIPRSKLPKLPQELVQALNFKMEQEALISTKQ